MYNNLGENQVKEIINAARVSAFFLDEDQAVTSKDIGSVREIEKWAKQCGSILFHDESLRLSSQFRCNGSDGYLAFLDDVLGIRHTANMDGFDMDYDIRVFSDPVLMRESLRELNKVNNKARMVAGYCYNWITKKAENADLYDIILPHGFEARWNFNSTSTWAIDEDSFDQVGCIHTSQGLEFDYVGVIIGQDLICRNHRVLTDYTKRARTDSSLNGLMKGQNDAFADRIIRNTYKTLLSRGQKGCFIYCEDEELQQYLTERLRLL